MMSKPTRKAEVEEATWVGDELARKESARFLTKYLNGKFSRRTASEETFVLNINAGWGLGKTYFLTNWAKDLKAEGHPVVYFDAWKSDYSDKPLLSFIAAIDLSLKETFKKTPPLTEKTKSVIETGLKLAKPAIPLLLSGYLKQKFGPEFEDLLAIGSSEDALGMAIEAAAERALDNHKTLQQSMESFKERLKDLAAEIEKSKFTLPLFILVDELDRCRPSYAIELLEEIKHLFGVAGVCFIVATDTKQLACSIKAVYGAEFDSERYLYRFFDQVYLLPEPNYLSFAKSLVKDLDEGGRRKIYIPDIRNGDGDMVAFMFSVLAEEFDLDLRSQQQCFRAFEATLIAWGREEKLHAIFLLFLLMLKHKSREAFSIYIKTTFLLTEDGIGGVRFGNRQLLSSVRRKTQGYGFDTVRYSIKELINIYTQLKALQQRGELVSEFNKPSRSSELEEQLFRELLGNSFPLESYAKLVAQAGQLSL